MKPNIAELGISEENRELYRKAFKGGYLPMWQFDLILKSEFDGWVEVERQAEEIERLKQIIADANKEHEETLLGEALRRDTDAMR